MTGIVNTVEEIMTKAQLIADDILSGRVPRELIIMCKNKPVMSINFDEGCYDVLDRKHLPFLIEAKYREPLPEKEFYTKYDIVQRQSIITDNREAVTDWLSDRVLLLSRKNANWIYNAIGMDQKVTPKQKAIVSLVCRSVSITDNYWVKLAGDKRNWEDINIRQNHLNETIAQIALHGKSGTLQGSLCSPELTTHGAYAKAWRRYPDGSLWLHKLGAHDASEAKIEIEVSNILDKMNVDHVPYIAAEDDGKFVCACPAITSDRLSIISASDLTSYFNIKGFDSKQELVKRDADAICKMSIVDYLVSNRDRHSENWGFMYNPDTMEILGCHPLFDHNNSFANEYMDSEDAKYMFNGISIKKTAMIAMRHVDFHFTKGFTRKDFMTTLHYKTFMRRASQLGIRVIPETPTEVMLRLLKRELLLRNRYDMLNEIADVMPRMGAELSESDIESMVKATVEAMVPAVVINENPIIDPVF